MHAFSRVVIQENLDPPIFLKVMLGYPFFQVVIPPRNSQAIPIICHRQRVCLNVGNRRIWLWETPQLWINDWFGGNRLERIGLVMKSVHDIFRSWSRWDTNNGPSISSIEGPLFRGLACFLAYPCLEGAAMR
jgi:hypothetical protein